MASRQQSNRAPDGVRQFRKWRLPAAVVAIASVALFAWLTSRAPSTTDADRAPARASTQQVKASTEPGSDATPGSETTSDAKEQGRRLAEVEQLLRGRYGSDAAREKALLAKFPGGYVILDMQATTAVVTHEARLQGYEIDTSRAFYIQRDKARFFIRMPGIRVAGGPPIEADDFEGIREVGRTYSVAGRRATQEVVVEVLAVPPSGLVVAVGMRPMPPG